MSTSSAARIAALSGRSSDSVLVFPTIDSTNTALKRMAREGAPEGLVLIADTQTAGRGRLGRSFFSPHGSGLYFSILLRPETFDPGRLTTLAAVVTADAISSLFGLEVGIKWVNDLFFEGKKLCGILAEGVGNGLAVLGIGVNLCRSAFPPELADIATSIEDITGKRPDRDPLAATLIRGFDEAPRSGFDHMDEYRRRSILLCKHVFLPDGEKVLVQAIEDDGALVVLGNDGSSRRIATGEVSIGPVK